MSSLKRAGWILIGVLIGGLAGSSMAATKAQLPEESRFKVSMKWSAGADGLISFVRDTNSNGCWLVLTKGQAVSVAVAPVSACN
jgi:hypothetical protein